MEPKDAPDFNLARARDADPATMDRLSVRAQEWRESWTTTQVHRSNLRSAVREAKASGHSYSQIEEATGLSLGTIQRMVK